MPGPEPFADIPDEPLLNIKAVSQSTNIEPVTLRAWERRYGVPKPARSEQGYRLYSERDVAILRWLKSKVDAGVKIKQAVAMLRTQAPQSLPHTSPLRAIPSESTNLEAMAENMLDAAHEFDAARVQQIISQAFALFPVEDVCLDLLLPVLQEVGHEWRTGAASLHVEHFLTNLIRQQVLALDAAMPLPSRRGKVVAGCAPGDLHEMGVLILAMILRRRGWEVVYLGQAVGTDRLEDALEAIQPDVVVMASSALESLGDLPEAARIASRADSVAGRFVFGGTLFSSVPSLADRVPGIYGGDTLVEAVQRIDGLLSGSWQPAPNEPRPVPDALASAYEVVHRSAVPLSEHLAGMLVEFGGDRITPRTAEAIAAEAVNALLAALRLGTTAVLEAPEYLIRPSLREYGIVAEQIGGLFEYFAGADMMPILADYLARL
ncbi:MAG TPA: cobalamin-dependent protein [Aggregatilineales bacterium]|nr:cobalamin-dependent protein [Aggregatilineales bacterium]